MERIRYTLQSATLFSFICLSLFTNLLFFTLLGDRPLLTPDEGRYAEIIREMVVRGDYVTPYLNGIEYFEKPTLFYWLGSLFVHLFGLKVIVLRAVNAALAVLGCLLTYLTLVHLTDRKTALYAAVILATCPLYFAMAHMISLDLPLTVGLMACFYSILLADTAKTPANRQRYFLLAASSAAFAVMTKGLVGILFPSLIVLTWLTVHGELKRLKDYAILPAILLFFALTLPWHILAALRHPEFFHFYFIEQHFLRYTQMGIGHYQPNWFFIPYALIGIFPWVFFLPQALYTSIMRLYHQAPSAKLDSFCLISIAIIFSFYSFSHSKLISYILPIVPMLAILLARYLRHISLDVLRPACLVITLVSISLGIYSQRLSATAAVVDPQQMAQYLGFATLVLGAGSLIAPGWPKQAVYILSTCSGVFLISALAAVPAIDKSNVAALADKIKPILNKNDVVITYNQYYQDLPFYLERPVSVLNWRNELSFGMKHTNAQAWMINDAGFWKHYYRDRTFVVLDRREYENIQKNHPKEKFYLVAKTMNNVLICNQKV